MKQTILKISEIHGNVQAAYEIVFQTSAGLIISCSSFICTEVNWSFTCGKSARSEIMPNGHIALKKKMSAPDGSISDFPSVRIPLPPHFFSLSQLAFLAFLFEWF